MLTLYTVRCTSRDTRTYFVFNNHLGCISLFVTSKSADICIFYSNNSNKNSVMVFLTSMKSKHGYFIFTLILYIDDDNEMHLPKLT